MGYLVMISQNNIERLNMPTTNYTALFPSTIPSQTGNSGKFLTTDGSKVSWATVTSTPAASSVTFTATGNISSTNVQAAIAELDTKKQAALVSGTNIKTVNGTSVLGSGDIAISGGATLSDDTSTNATYYPCLATATSGTMTTTKTSSTKLSYNPSTGTLNSVIFNSTSDANKKTDVVTASGLRVVDLLRGVEFNWKDSGTKSSGVIAQEIEGVLPHLVATDSEGMKSVNYDGIVAYLIEAIKELSAKVDELKGA